MFFIWLWIHKNIKCSLRRGLGCHEDAVERDRARRVDRHRLDLRGGQRLERVGRIEAVVVLALGYGQDQNVPARLILGLPGAFLAGVRPTRDPQASHPL